MIEGNLVLENERDAESLGARFQAAREARSLPVEQVAHETRIRAQRIREIEKNDLSHFCHPSYARMFLTDYAKYLGIPVTEIKHLLPASGAVGCEGYQYLQEEHDQSFPSVGRSIRPQRVVRALAFGLAMIGVLVLTGVGVITWRNLERLHPSNVAAQTVVEAPKAEAPAPAARPAAEPAPAVPNEPGQTSATVISDQMFASGVIDSDRAVR